MSCVVIRSSSPSLSILVVQSLGVGVCILVLSAHPPIYLVFLSLFYTRFESNYASLAHSGQYSDLVPVKMIGIINQY
jgi:hypothetical protein